MGRKHGDQCPKCKTGKLFIDPKSVRYDVQDAGSWSQITWACNNDKCDYTNKNFTVGLNE